MDSAEAHQAQQPEVPDLVRVVNRVAHLENLMDQVISSYCSPRAKAFDFMWTVVLESSVMPLGGKARVVAAVAQMLRCAFDRNSMQRVMALRNAFAHNATNANQAVYFGRTDEESYGYCQFLTLSQSGEIKIETRHEAFAEFIELSTKVKQSLLQLREAVKKDLEAGTPLPPHAPGVPFAKTKPTKPKK